MGEVSGHTAILGRLLERLREGEEAARHEVINHASERLEALARRMLRCYPRLRQATCSRTPSCGCTARWRLFGQNPRRNSTALPQRKSGGS
jgi:hypothetical protein